VAAATSLGQVTAEGLRRLISPGTSANTFTARLRILVTARYLTRVEVIAGLRRVYLYGAGPRAREPGSPRPWTPAPHQLDHTLAVEATLVRLMDPAVTPALTRSEWSGEADYRAWADPGDPYPDLGIRWTAVDDGRQLAGQWAVEVDRATEARGAWRRKLGRYLADYSLRQLIVAVTTSDARARNLAGLAAEVGYPTAATSLTALLQHPDPPVWDSWQRRRSTLTETSLALAVKPTTRSTTAADHDRR